MGSHLKLGDTMYCPATAIGGATEPLCDYENDMDPQEAWESKMYITASNFLSTMHLVVLQQGA
jgi:hypothetical protein